MTGAKTLTAGAVTYELEIPIDAPRERVWQALTDETNAWWLPDFHMVDPDSTVTFDIQAGGHLVEHSADGGSLLWMTVHWARPKQFTLYLVGHIAPDWGGPATYNLKFALEETDVGCVLKVTDSHHGHIDDGNIRSLQEGWTTLFTDGLKQFIEQGVRYDSK